MKTAAIWMAAMLTAMATCGCADHSNANGQARKDPNTLKSSNGQPLIVIDDSPLNPPPRPADPEALPEDDANHWHDMEYAGWKCTKVNLPKSPADGPEGKTVWCLRHMDHPYTTAYVNGMQKVADACGMKLKVLTAGNADITVQSRQVDQAVNAHPDMVIILPVDAKAVVPMVRKLNKAGVPVIASNLIPVDGPCSTSSPGPGPTTGASSACSHASSPNE